MMRMKQSFYYNGTILTMEGHVPQYVEAVLVEGGVHGAKKTEYPSLHRYFCLFLN